MNYERIMVCARGWNYSYRLAWKARRQAAGYSEEEIQAADILGRARSNAHSDQFAKYGDPASGKMLDGSGGWAAFRDDALDAHILEHSDREWYAEAATILRAAKMPKLVAA